MTKKDVAEVEVMGEGTIETFEFTDEDGQEHCFVVESRFKVGKDDYVALLEVDPAIFEGENEEHGHDHVHGNEHDHTYACSEECDCGHHHDYGHAHAVEDVEEEPNIILAKIVTDVNGEVDIEVPTDKEFEKAVKVYESLEA